MKKGLLIGGGVIAVIVVAVVVFFIVGFSDIVKTAVETAGSEVTKVKVTLDDADVSPTEGKAALRGLTVGNPPGFKTDNAFKLGKIAVSLDIASLTKDTIVIREILVTKPQVTYELGENGNNIETIQKNVASYAGGGGGGGEASSDSGGKKLIIENLYIRGGKVRISAAPLGGKTMDADLPEIHLKNIGKKEGGATPDQVAEQVMAAVTKRVGGFVGGLDISGVFQGVEVIPDALKGVAGGTAGKAIEGAGEAVGGAVKGAGDKLKKLFGD